jgi:hypothetical protein
MRHLMGLAWGKFHPAIADALGGNEKSPMMDLRFSHQRRRANGKLTTDRCQLKTDNGSARGGTTGQPPPWFPVLGSIYPNPKLLTAKAPRTPRPEGLIGEDKRNF